MQDPATAAMNPTKKPVVVMACTATAVAVVAVTISNTTSAAASTGAEMAPTVPEL
jgi:hypothetical protein